MEMTQTRAGLFTPIGGVSGIVVIDFFGERKAHPPLGAWAEVYHGVDVVVTGSHGNRTAPSGWMMRLVRLVG